MSLAALDGTPLIQVGAAGREGVPGAVGLSSATIDAANEAIIMVGRVLTSDGGSHTIDTTGSSALEWRAGGVTFANAGTTVKVGLAAVDLVNGPPVRAAHVADVITMDVSKTHTGGGGGVTGAAWQTNVPGAGTKTIAHGDLVAFCIQMTARAGADSVVIIMPGIFFALQRPSVTGFLGGAYADNAKTPNALIVFSDGALGWFEVSYVVTTGATTTWNSSSATKEYGNLLQFPFTTAAYGICAGSIVLPADAELILYSDPLGTPVAERTVSLDANALSMATTAVTYELFATPYTIPANTPVAAIVKPTTTTDIQFTYVSHNAAAHQVVWHNGTNGYAVNRASGAFAAQNTSKDRYGIGLLIGAFARYEGYPASRKALGM